MAKLTKNTAYAEIEAIPDHNIFEDIRKEARPPIFWSNFRSLAPVLYTHAFSKDAEISKIRDKCVGEELLKSKSLIEGMHAQIQTAKPEDIDIVKAVEAIKILEDRIEILKHLKNPILKEGEKDVLKYEIKGTTRTVEVETKKLMESIDFISKDQFIEEEKTAEKNSAMIPVEEEEKFLEHKLKNFEFKSTESDTLDRKTMISVMGKISEFAEFRLKDIVKSTQETRLKYYRKEDSKYVMACHASLLKEEENYNYCTQAVISKLKINPHVFRQTESLIANDQELQMELLQKGMKKGVHGVDVPEDLTKERTFELYKDASEKALDEYKKLKDYVKIYGPMLAPLVYQHLITDYLKDTHGIDEAVFKASLANSNVFEDQEFMKFMQEQQFKLLSVDQPEMAAQQMPDMMASLPKSSQV